MRSKDIPMVTTTLTELGVKAIPDVTGGLNADLKVAKIPGKQSTIYLASMETRPMVGGMLAYLVNTLAKERQGGLNDYAGIIGDLDLPEKARHKYAENTTKQLDHDHRHSFIGTVYAEIDKSHRERWTKAFHSDFYTISDLVAFYSSLHPRTFDSVVQDAQTHRRKFNPGEVDSSGNSWLTLLNSEDFKLLGNERFRHLNNLVTAQLSPEEIRLIILKKDLEWHTIVDFESSKVYTTPHFAHGKLLVLPPNRLLIDLQTQEASLNAEFEADINGGDIKWSIADYSIEFGRVYDQARLSNSALTPVIAWKKDPQGRHYLTQDNVAKIAGPFIPTNGDVLLGRVLAAQLTRGITDLWQEEMSLHRGGPKNGIMGAQVLILASLPHPNFGGRVLRDPDGILSKIEAAFS